ncbi:hypothetical protein AVEN_201883-1 [Araneus ventricosus]|uniref:Uncharacterized protein n=1 Tax=Araneus ventricosus TaxID=182803 RepID=A0A4Y2G295_ARAVE|nr:hypothetical protein AVEN_201883-1 [Araneus ventricosus]
MFGSAPSKINPSLLLSNAEACITSNRLIHPMVKLTHRHLFPSKLICMYQILKSSATSAKSLLGVALSKELRSLPLGVARVVLSAENAHFPIKAILFAGIPGKRSLSH